MNTILTIPAEKTKIGVPILPKSVIYSNPHKHPIFWWNKRHVRSVKVEPIMTNAKDEVFVAKYIDTKTGTIFIDKRSAEHYLGVKILEPEYIGQIYAERFRNVFAYYLCKNCGYVGCLKIDVCFQGPFNMVTRLTKTIANLPCVKCNQTIPVDINVEPCTDDHTLSEDCDWK